MRTPPFLTAPAAHAIVDLRFMAHTTALLTAAPTQR